MTVRRTFFPSISLKSLCRLIRQSFPNPPAIAASIQDLTRRAWTSIVSQAARLLEAVTPSRPLASVGLAIALATAICVARGPSSVLVPTFKELDYFEQTDLIFQLYTSIPPLLLFGDLSIINSVKATHNLNLDTNPTQHDDISNHTSLEPRPPRWLLNGDGEYVPDHVFVNSLIDAISSFFEERPLNLARWFLRDDNALGTTQSSPASRSEFKGTKYPCQHHHLPETPSKSIEILQQRVNKAVAKFAVEHDLVMKRMRRVTDNSMEAVRNHTATRDTFLDRMKRTRYDPAAAYGGSDAARLACYREHSNSTDSPSTSPCDQRPWTHLAFTFNQVNNMTALDLLTMLQCHLDRFQSTEPRCGYVGPPPGQELSAFIPYYQESIQNLVKALEELLDQLKQTHQGVYNSDPSPSPQCIDAEIGRFCLFNCSVREVEAMAMFLQNIAVPRLEYMYNTASISMKILGEAERRREVLENKVSPFTSPYWRNRWVDWLPNWPDLTLPVFPSLDALRHEARGSLDRLGVRRDDFEERVRALDRVYWSSPSYKPNDSETWFQDCVVECESERRSPSNMTQSMSSERGTENQEDVPRARRWWEILFPELRDEERN